MNLEARARAHRSDLARGVAHGAIYISVGSGDIRLLDSGRADRSARIFLVASTHCILLSSAAPVHRKRIDGISAWQRRTESVLAIEIDPPGIKKGNYRGKLNGALAGRVENQGERSSSDTLLRDCTTLRFLLRSCRHFQTAVNAEASRRSTSKQ
jgi:hypothetical protein